MIEDKKTFLLNIIERTWIFDCTQILKLQWTLVKNKKAFCLKSQSVGLWCKYNDIRNDKHNQFVEMKTE